MRHYHVLDSSLSLSTLEWRRFRPDGHFDAEAIGILNATEEPWSEATVGIGTVPKFEC